MSGTPGALPPEGSLDRVAGVNGSMSPQEAGVARYRAALGFARAGGVWAWGDWVRLSAAERAAAILAGDHVCRARATQLGNAARDPAAAAEIIAPVDGGAAAREVVADIEAQLLVDGLEGRR